MNLMIQMANLLGKASKALPNKECRIFKARFFAYIVEMLRLKREKLNVSKEVKRPDQRCASAVNPNLENQTKFLEGLPLEYKMPRAVSQRLSTTQ